MSLDAHMQYYGNTSDFGKIMALINDLLTKPFSFTASTAFDSKVFVLMVRTRVIVVGRALGCGVWEIHLGNCSLKWERLLFVASSGARPSGDAENLFNSRFSIKIPWNPLKMAFTWCMGGRIAGLAVLIWRSRDLQQPADSKSFPHLNLPHTRYLPSAHRLTNLFIIARRAVLLQINGFSSNNDNDP